MSATTTSARSPGSFNNLHRSHSHSRSSTTPAARPTRDSASVGQSVPPLPFTASLSPNKRFGASQHARTPSPNYFGFAFDTAEASPSRYTRANWSPPSSNVRSTAAASPSVIPVDQNPEFEAFRRQSETNSFKLGGFPDFKPPSIRGGASTFEGSNKPSHRSSEPPTNNNSSQCAENKPKSAMEESNAHLQPKPKSPKRLLSSDSNVLDRPRRDSPAGFTDAEFSQHSESNISRSLNNDRFSAPPKNLGPARTLTNRSETLPSSLEGNEPNMITSQHTVNILDSAHEEVLLLDLRVSTQFARSRISGALSLCIPTTLLKRASFNVQKLAETFKDEHQRQKFEKWRNSKYIIVYDASSSLPKDASICVNTLKKFANDGWEGFSYIIKGGFAEFSKLFPKLIDTHLEGTTNPNTPNLTLESARPEVAPVVGGCPLPANKTAANPFFGNIRQNMDLIGGVGQMPVHHPANLSKQAFSDLPQWLRHASDEKNNGKAVSEKFLQIEKREQKRMQQALSGNVEYGSPNTSDTQKVQIAGIEKGTKNRYNNIWPFEHSRVKLAGVPDGGCDYINANYVGTEWSSKRYIATQGPIPDTFSDFWSMIWDHDIRVMVMLTAEKEGGQVKAHRYWEDRQYGPLTLHFLSEHRASIEPSRIHHRRKKDHPAKSPRRSTNPIPNANSNASSSQTLLRVPSSLEPQTLAKDEPYVIVRRFTLSHNNRPFERMREITQLQYATWPDFGAPAHPAHLLGLVEQCDAVVRAINRQKGEVEERPVLVHCSAGCGRTGTFCTVDTVIDMLKRQKQKHNSKKDASNGSSYYPRREAAEVRDSTSMDIDATGPGSFQQMRLSKEGGDPFFTEQQPSVSSEPKKMENEVEKEDWLGRDDIDLVEKTVEEFRHQRLSMVQSLRQFVLCYESVLEWMAGLTPRTA
ncbi:MAG: hypothetical protein M1820_005790 [Bogoriella megaspora]|nr:MAG: hypothetical protein M1820_005790 [Bogoriella megaspora]